MSRKALFLSMIGISLGCSGVVAAQSAGLDALSRLEHGEWELRERDSARPPRRICIGDANQLLQPRHPNQQCKRFVVRDGPQRASVTYDCADAGQGSTDVRVETSRLVQIASQGVSDGAPFVLAIEGRHVGMCKTAALSR